MIFSRSAPAQCRLYKTFLVFESEFRMVRVVENDLRIEDSYLFLKFVKVTLFQTILLDRFHNRHDEISDLQDECFQFGIKRG